MKTGVNFDELPSVCKNCEKLRCISIYMNSTAYYSCGYPNCEHRNELYSIYKEEEDK